MSSSDKELSAPSNATDQPPWTAASSWAAHWARPPASAPRSPLARRRRPARPCATIRRPAARRRSTGSDIAQRYAAPAGARPALFRVEMDIADCEVDGKIPADLSGAFFRVGPDAQFPLRAGNIPFDGEGHVSQLPASTTAMCSFKSRFVRNERYVAQEKAGKILFPMYRNPYLDDPSVKGKSRGTHNTHIIHHNGMLLALKEDSPPAAMDLNTLATLDPVYTLQRTSSRAPPSPRIPSSIRRPAT